MMGKPQQEHEWLAQLLGEWTFESQADCGPDGSQVKSTGRETVRSLGGMWVICDGQGEMPSGTEMGYMQMTLGFNPQTKRYVGTWVGSMMTHLWIYDGEMDAARRVLTLNSVGPSFTSEGAMAKYQDIIEIVAPDHRILRSRTQDESGNWKQFMEAHYRKVK